MPGLQIYICIVTGVTVAVCLCNGLDGSFLGQKYSLDIAPQDILSLDIYSTGYSSIRCYPTRYFPTRYSSIKYSSIRYSSTPLLPSSDTMMQVNQIMLHADQK